MIHWKTALSFTFGANGLLLTFRISLGIIYYHVYKSVGFCMECGNKTSLKLLIKIFFFSPYLSNDTFYLQGLYTGHGVSL